MKLVKRLTAIASSLLIMFSIAGMNVFAASTTQDGLEISITADKKAYSKDEKITATLSVTNTNDEDITNLSMETIIPDGYYIPDNRNTNLSAAVLKSKESVSLSAEFIPDSVRIEPVKADTDEKTSEEIPTKDDKTNEPSTAQNITPKSNNNNTDDAKSHNIIVNTSDSSWMNIIACIVLICVSASVIILLVKRKSGKRFLSFVICMSLVGSIAAIIPIQADALQTQPRSVNIEESVKVNGALLTLSANVGYEISGENLFTGDNSDEQVIVYFFKPDDWDNPYINFYSVDSDEESAVFADMQEVSDGWYGYTIENCKAAKVSFTDKLKHIPENAAEWLDAKGIMWYKNDIWCDSETDTDNDMLPDYMELLLGSNINNPDSDGDELPDGYEALTLGTDPTNADTNNNTITDANEDTDGDGLNNLEEYRLGTDPHNKDSDNDQLTDYDELFIYGTDPKNDDSDKDKLSDGDEIALGFDPNNKDSDNNGIIDGDEIIHQVISEDNEGLSYVNNDDNSYSIALEIDAAGSAIKTICAKKSPYDNAMSNTAILGRIISLSCESVHDIENIKIEIKIDDDIVHKPENNNLSKSEINGIKRFKIFKYDEESNILLPTDCDYDTENNVIILNDDSFGNYCIMDLRKWVENMGIKVNDEPIEEEKELPAGMVYGKRSTGSGASQNNSDDEYVIDDEFFSGDDYINTDLPLYTSKNNNVDIVFILQSEGVASQEFFKQVKYIRGIAECLMSAFDNTRIAVMLSKSNEASFLISSESSKWFTKYSDLFIKLDEISYSRYNDYINRGAAFDKLIKSTDFRASSYKFVYLMHNTISTVQDGYHDQIDSCNLLDINYSEILPEGLYYVSSEYCSKVKEAVSNSGGQYFYMSNYYDDIKKITSNIYNSVPFEYTDNTPENYYVTVTPSNWNQVKLNKPLEKDALTDTDGDGLTDWEETDYNNSSITVYSDNSTRLPDIIEYSVYQNKPEIITNIESIMEHIGIYNPQRIKVLAVKSYPDDSDSDGDGVLDIIDARPLINDIKRIELKSPYTSIYHWDFSTSCFVPSYGGNQAWFINPINEYGCGVIASTDTILYLLRNNENFQNNSILNEICTSNDFDSLGIIDYAAYYRIVSEFEEDFFDVNILETNFGVNIFGIPYGLISNDFFGFSNYYNWNLYAEWNGNYFMQKCISLDDIVSQINNDIPTIISIDTETGVMLYDCSVISNKKPTECIVFENEEPDKKKRVRDHYVAVTAVIYDGDKSWLEISTWGEKKCIDFNEYLSCITESYYLHDKMESLYNNNYLKIFCKPSYD